MLKIDLLHRALLKTSLNGLHNQGEWRKFRKGERQQMFMYARLRALAAHALAHVILSYVIFPFQYFHM